MEVHKNTYSKSELDEIKRFLLNSRKLHNELMDVIEDCIKECRKEYHDNYTNETIVSADAFAMYNMDYLANSIGYICNKMYLKLKQDCNNKLLEDASIDLRTLEEYFAKWYMEESEVVYEVKRFMIKCCELGAEVDMACWKDDLNKAARGRIVGGGFGIEGSIKGMAVAGIANAIIGAGYSVKNTVVGVGRVLMRDHKITKAILNENTRDYMELCLSGDLRNFLDYSAEVYNIISEETKDIFQYYNYRPF